MVTLYYGSGSCTIEGSQIRGVEIRYRGAVNIAKTANDNFVIAHQNNGIMIFPIGEGFLNDLFTYTGELKVISVIAADNNTEKVRVIIKKVMDYSELMNTNSEDLTTKSEGLNASHRYKAKVNKTRLAQETINNLHTGSHDGDLYKADGTTYNGDFHIHIESGKAMTEKVHNDLSEDLYIIRIDDNQLVLTGEVDQTRQTRRTRTTRATSSGSSGGMGGGY